jgi:hypothetical protein
MASKWAVGCGQWAVKVGLSADCAALRTRTARRPRKRMCKAPLLPTAPCPLPTRSGVSLLEVLVSMFVMLFGLMGVAAIFPVGNHYAGRAEQFDRAAVLADEALAELQARGMLDVGVWLYPELPPSSAGEVNVNGIYNVIQGPTHVSPGIFNYVTNNGRGPGHAFVIDPMGVAAGMYATPRVTNLDVFPYGQPSNPTYANPWLNQMGGTSGGGGTRWPIRRVTVPANDFTPSMRPRVAETICRLQDDLVNAEQERDDRPGIQQFTVNNNGTPNNPADDVPLQRQYSGSYSWLATVVPTERAPTIAGGGPLNGFNPLQPRHPQYTTQRYDVSVAVFNRRVETPSADSERMLHAQLTTQGELILYHDDTNAGVAGPIVDAALRDIRPGNYIALAGMRSNGQFVMKWYKLLSLDIENSIVVVSGLGGQRPVRYATVQGPDWPPEPPTSGKPAGFPIQNLRAIILPGVIAVATEKLTMQTDYSAFAVGALVRPQ